MNFCWQFYNIHSLISYFKFSFKSKIQTNNSQVNISIPTAAVKPEPPEKAVDPIKKQEELFQAMQAQYEVARATTHTMRGVGLGFQRGQY